MVYNESLYYCNCCMPEQISYLAKFKLLRYGPKYSWSITLSDFSINCRTLKWAVSNEEINGINCGFVRNGSLGFTDFWHNDRWFKYLKTDRFLFSRKIYICPNLGKKGPVWAQNRAFWAFSKNLPSQFFLEII